MSPSRIASDTTPAAVYVRYLNMVFFGSNKPDAVSTLSETRSSYRNKKKRKLMSKRRSDLVGRYKRKRIAKRLETNGSSKPVIRQVISSFISYPIGWSVVVRSFIGLFDCSVVQSFVCWFVRRSVYSFVRSVVGSFVFSVVHGSFVNSLVRSRFVCLFARSRSLITTNIHAKGKIKMFSRKLPLWRG